MIRMVQIFDMYTSLSNHFHSRIFIKFEDLKNRRFVSAFPIKRQWWAGPDLNRRPSARQADVLTELDDRPIANLGCFSGI